MKKYNLGFTLAEVLITLGIIGVVAAITLPILVANINDRVNNERYKNIVQKVTQAMEQMKAHGMLNVNYGTTEAFVDEFQKYLKISKRCSADNIADCWPTEKVIDSNGKEFEVSKAKTDENLSLETYTNNVGLVLADGASLIINYNPSDSLTLDVGDPVKTLIGFPYTTNVTNSIDFVTDVNGKKGPNKEKVGNKNYDIRNLRSAKFAKGFVCPAEGLEIPGIGCIVKVGTAKWDAINDLCNAMEGFSLASMETLDAIYNQRNNYPDFIPNTGWFWSSTPSPYGEGAAMRVNFSGGGHDSQPKNYGLGGFCFGKRATNSQ